MTLEEKIAKLAERAEARAAEPFPSMIEAFEWMRRAYRAERLLHAGAICAYRHVAGYLREEDRGRAKWLLKPFSIVVPPRNTQGESKIIANLLLSQATALVDEVE